MLSKSESVVDISRSLVSERMRRDERTADCLVLRDISVVEPWWIGVCLLYLRVLTKQMVS